MTEKDSFNTEPKDEYDVDIKACSAMDCTGLIPSLPQSEAERESYEDLYPYTPSAFKAERRDGKESGEDSRSQVR